MSTPIIALAADPHETPTVWSEAWHRRFRNLCWFLLGMGIGFALTAISDAVICRLLD